MKRRRKQSGRLRQRREHSRSSKRLIIPEKHPLTNVELERYAAYFKIPHFRGVFMRNSLPNRIRTKERGIINLDSDDGMGTHWVAYKKNGSQIVYFDSYGNLPPTLETLDYFNSNGPCQIQYNYDVYQKFNTVNCGHLCLRFISQ